MTHKEDLNMMEYVKLDGIQPEISKLIYGTPSGVSGDDPERAIEILDMAAEKGWTVSQLALAWLFSQGLNIMPIVNPTGCAHIEDNLAALSYRLTEEEVEWLRTGVK